MAVLSEADRAAVWAQWMRDNRDGVSVTKPQLRAAADALDDYLNANAAAINSAIPQPARGALTAAQKARLLSMVAMQRYAKGV